MLSMTPFQSWGTILLLFLFVWGLIIIARELDARASEKRAVRDAAVEAETVEEPTRRPTLNIVPKRDDPELYDHQIHGL